jgi:arylsulfatase A-like enzyme
MPSLALRVRLSQGERKRGGFFSPWEKVRMRARLGRNSLLKPLLLVLLFSVVPIALSEQAPANDRHVVVVVWDGMRPDSITERDTPTLWKLARDGVFFRQHHSVYPTATNVNGAAIATGVYPNRNSLLANREYRPQINPRTAFENSEPSIIKKGDELTGGKYLAAPTIAEIVHAAGRRTAITGTKSVAFLHDRHAEWTTGASTDFLIKFAAAPMPPSLRGETVRLLGPFLTESGKTSDQRNTYATRALTEILWREGLPAFSLLWLSDPDITQHEYAPGSELSVAAVRSSDRNLALVLEALAKKNARETTDILVVSDHGFSTIERSLDFAAELHKAGFDATDNFERTPKAGQIMVVGNGGTILFYVIEHDRAVTARLIEWLQRSDFAGVVFAREKFEGTFPLDFVRANSAEAPDVMVALRWNAKPNRFGVPGQIITDSARGAGKGSHATLSEFDVHNTLIAAGPDFRRGVTSDVPSANIDLAPTVLHLLGLDPVPQKFDGRVLAEAMNGRFTKPEALNKTLEANRKFSSGEWKQHLRISLVGETVYIDEGNGAFEGLASKQ